MHIIEITNAIKVGVCVSLAFLVVDDRTLLKISHVSLRTNFTTIFVALRITHVVHITIYTLKVHHNKQAIQTRNQMEHKRTQSSGYNPKVFPSCLYVLSVAKYFTLRKL